jgi:uncharacterized membrane protein
VNGQRRIRLALLTATLLAAVLRFWRIGAQSFWDDEVATFRAAALSLKQIWSIIPLIDSNPPLIYTLLHFWRGFGETELGLRSLAAILGALSAPAAYLALRRLIGARAAVGAAFLVAVNPLAIYGGQEVRYNTLVTLATLLATWAFAATLVEARRSRAVALFVFASLAIYSHYFAFFVVAAMVVVLLAHAATLLTGLRRDRPALAWLALVGLHTRSAATRAQCTAALATYGAALAERWRGVALAFCALAGAGLMFLPFSKFFLIQLLRGVQWREPAGLLAVLRGAAIWTFVGHSVTAPPTFVHALGRWAQQHETAHLWLLLALVAPIGAVAAYGMIARRDETKRGALAIFVLVPLAGVLTTSRLAPIFDPRYLLPLVPFALGALAAGLRALWDAKRRTLAGAAAAWLLALTGLSLHDYYYSPAHWRQDWRGVAQRVSAEAEPDATVLFYNFYNSLAFLHYYEQVPRRPPVQYLYVLEERDNPLDAKRRRVAQTLDGIARGGRPVWLIDYHGALDDPYDDVRHGLRDRGWERASQECRMPGLWRYCVEHWLPVARLPSILRDSFDFAAQPPADWQLASGWLPGDGERRWIAAAAVTRFRRPAGTVRARIHFFANVEYLGGPTIVRAAAGVVPVGEVRVARNDDVEWTTAPFAFPDDRAPWVELTLTADRAFVPDDVTHDGDRTPKSLLVKSVALERVDE